MRLVFPGPHLQVINCDDADLGAELGGFTEENKEYVLCLEPHAENNNVRTVNENRSVQVCNVLRSQLEPNQSRAVPALEKDTLEGTSAHTDERCLLVVIT